MTLFLIYLLCYLLGFLGYVLLQAYASVRSSSNGLKTVGAWLTIMWPVITGRGIAGAILMLIWIRIPDIFSRLIGGIVPGVTFPLNEGTAAAFGFLFDCFLDKLLAIVGIKVEIPQLAPPSGG